MTTTPTPATMPAHLMQEIPGLEYFTAVGRAAQMLPKESPAAAAGADSALDQLFGYYRAAA